MKKLVLYFILAFSVVLSSCREDEIFDDGLLNGGNLSSVITFGCEIPKEIEISTRSIGSEASQYRINNVYVCLFDAQGNRAYGRFFSPNEKVNTAMNAEDIAKNKNKWYFGKNNTGGKSTYWGQINAALPVLQGGKLYVVGNANLLDLSNDLLEAQTRTLSDFQNIMVSTTSNSLYRTQLIMVGGADVNVTANNDGKTVKIELINQNKPNKIVLRRIDAKVQFKIRVASPAEQNAYNNELIAQGKPVSSQIDGFEPDKWELKKLPKNVYLIDDANAQHAMNDPAYKYYNIEPANFETQTREPDSHDDISGAGYKHEYHGFSFYMLENKQPQAAIRNYTDRDIRKTINNPGGMDDGRYDQTGQSTGDIWVHAPKDATYLKISGSLRMMKDVPDQALGHPVETMFNADVTYYIHLGDIKKNMGDFSVLRNTSYTYNVVIYGADKIKVEVEEDKEEEPGATGDTYIAREAYCEFDAHYGQRVLRFCAEHIEVSEEGKVNITWYVKTPFGEGEPKNGIGGLDYKWVRFMRNPVVEKDGKRIFSRNNCFYPGDDSPKLMDVYEFNEYLTQQAKYWHWNNRHTAEGDFHYDQDFLLDYDGVHHSIYFTVFVDEYYYDKNPVTGENIGWTQFVNKEDRLMHLLSRTKRSKDDESSVTESVVTIRQKAIQTPYVMDGNLGAWGVETVDEPVITYPVPGKIQNPSDPNSPLTQDKMEYYPTFFYKENNLTKEDYGTDETKPGMVNTKKYFLGSPNNRWDSYLNIQKITDLSDGSTVKVLPENGQSLLKTGERTLKNSILLRNRNFNGDDIIDENEIKWYIGDRNQISSLAMADVGISGDAKLFNIENEMKYRTGQSWGNPDPQFKLPMTGSKASSALKGLVRIVPSDGKKLIWVEELFSISDYGADYGWINPDAQYSIRCVRNLRGNNKAENEIDDIIPAPTKKNGHYFFDMSRVNRLSLRHRGVKVEPDLIILDPSTEREENSYLPLGLEVIPELISYSGSYDDLKSDLENSNNPVHSSTGTWRVPNLREAGLLYLYACEEINNYIYVSTYYSLYGTTISGYSPNQTWHIKNNLATMGESASHLVRVRDWDPRKK